MLELWQVEGEGARCVARILTEPSEMLELWQDTDEFDAWNARSKRFLRASDKGATTRNKWRTVQIRRQPSD